VENLELRRAATKKRISGLIIKIGKAGVRLFLIKNETKQRN